jgi:hypothetical protein
VADGSGLRRHFGRAGHGVTGLDATGRVDCATPRKRIQSDRIPGFLQTSATCLRALLRCGYPRVFR